MTDAFLDVFLGDTHAGSIKRSARQAPRFHPAGTVRLSMGRTGDDAWPPDFTHAWFDNLLPEEDTRDRVAARFDLRREDTFGLLREIGWECAGAVAVLPVGARPVGGSYQDVSLDDLLARLDALPRRPYDPDAAVRMSLGGGQPKMVARLAGGQWSLPLGGAPSTHILKPEPERFPGLVVAEAWALAVASAAAPTAKADVLAVDDHIPTLVVERYDRTIGADGSIQRLHQEDGCQVLGVESVAKYAEHPARAHQPSFARMAAALLREARDPLAELQALLRAVTVHVVFGDSDAHAKNFSFLHDPDRLLTVAPIYDLVPTEAFIGQRLLAMPVGGRFRIDQVGVGQLVSEARVWRLDDASARAAVAQTIDALRAAVAAADARFPGVPERVRKRAVARIEGLAATG